MNKCRKYLAILLSVLMALSALPFAGAAVDGAAPCEHTDANRDNLCDYCKSELYIERSWYESTGAVIDTQLAIPMGSGIVTPETLTLEAGKYYVVDEDVEVTGRIIANGTPDNPSCLILRDGYTLKAAEGIGVSSGHELRIYAQSKDSGKIIASGNTDSAGIGGAHRENCGILVICGGDISASGGERGAGIGGGSTGNSGNISILGGTITASGSTRSAGIGAGYNSHGGTVTIYGGKVTSNGGENGEGIGGYCYKDNSYHGTLKVCGGDITAKGGDYSAGVGHNVEMYGGKLKAIGNEGGAGIGGGYNYGGGSFLMYGGTVEAVGGEGGAGIGGGRNGAAGDFEIHSGTVTATGGSYSAGIGGGGSYSQAGDFKGGPGGTVKMYGGNVTAVGGYAGAGVGGGATGQGGGVTIYGGNLTAKGDYRAAGIGGGLDAAGGSFTIYDGTVTAYGGNLSAGIGGGFQANGGSFRMIAGNVTATGSQAPGIGGGNHAPEMGSFYVTAVVEINAGSGAPGSETAVEKYITSRDSYINISGYCGHTDADGDRVCDYCEKGLYIDRAWDSGKKSVVDTVKNIPDDAEVITDSTTVLSSGKWYIADGNVRIRGTLTVDGDAVIVLKDNCNLRVANGLVENGIRVEEGSSLSVYAQSDGAGAGSLTVIGDIHSAGIGSGREHNCGDIAIYGGNITAAGGQFGAGIGGGVDGNGGNVAFYGGIITAAGGDGGAGVGGGFFADGGNVNIYGGKVTASGGWLGAGIGGGKEGNGGNVTICGGTVIASCGVYSDLIGHGSAEDPHIWLENGSIAVGDGTVLYSGTDGTVMNPIRGSYYNLLNDDKYYNGEGLGRVYFYADTNGTAQNRIIYREYNPEIGENVNKFVTENAVFPVSALDNCPVQWIAADGDITIDGPITINGNVNLILKDNCTLTVKDRIIVEGGNSLTIYVQSSGDATGKLIAEAGIGSGSKTECGTITIYGGDITAAGKENMAAIGGGYRGGAGTITIYGGKVTADGGDNAPGIGNGAMGNGGNVTIYGGKVTATGTEDGIIAENVAVYDAQVTSNGVPLESGHIHHMNKIAVRDATCTETGITTTFYICTGDHSCGRIYSDPAGETELTTEQANGYVTPALGHSFTSGEYSDNHNGTHSEKCIRCSKCGNAEPHELVNGKCTKCNYCEHLSGTYSFSWNDTYTRCKATEKCDICGEIMLVQYSFDVSFAEDTAGKDCKTSGKGHYEAVFANLGIIGKTDSVIDTEYGPHIYKDYVCEVCGDELLDDAKAAAKEAIDTAAGENPDSTVKTVCDGAKSGIDAAETVAEVFEAQDEWLAVIDKINSGDEAAAALAKAQAALAEVQKALEEKTGALGTAEENLDTANDALSEAQNALGEKAAALKTAEVNLAAANTALDEAKSQVDTLTAELEKAQDELDETKTVLDGTKAALDTAKNEKSALETQLEAKETELDNLKDSADAKDDEIAALEDDINGLEADIKTKDREITEKANEIAALEKSVGKLEKTVEEKNDELTAKADEISALEDNVSALENEVAEAKSEIAEKNGQIETLSKQLEEAKAEIEELKKGEDTSCPYCGKEKHEGFFDKVICFFKRIGYCFKLLFDFSMDRKN